MRRSAFGARPLARVIEEEIKRKLTDELLFGELSGGGKVTVGAEKSEIELAFEAAPPPAPRRRKLLPAETA